MQPGRASVTAVVAATMRAAHLVLDGEPKIFVDPLAGPLAGAADEAALRQKLGRLSAAIEADVGPDRAGAVFRYMRSIMVLRSRYTEDELGVAVERGVRQYVILGAGLDSFAYRTSGPSEGLRVFEVDLGETQEAKRARLRELGIEQPARLSFVPLDLERRTLVESLCAGGFRKDAPAFVSWLGTTQYLTEDSVMATLSELASLAPDSEVVLQYQVAEHLLPEPDRELFRIISRRAKESGEPWLTLFDPSDLATRLRGLGFSDVSDFGPQQAAARYFAGRQDRLSPPGLSRLMNARVGSARRGTG